MQATNFSRSIGLTTVLLALSACGGGGDGSKTGQLTLGLTDGPAAAVDQVVIAFTGIELKPVGGAPFEIGGFDESSCPDTYDAMAGTCSIDLLTLQGEERKVVFSGEIEAGEYQWVRLKLNADRNVMDSYVMADGEMCSLYIPSGASRGLQVNGPVIVTANGQSDYTLDFSAAESIVTPPGLDMMTMAACAENYLLKPVVHLVDTTEVGAIAGTVPGTLLADSDSCVLSDDGTGAYAGAAVYVYEAPEGVATADDYDMDETYPNPVSMAIVKYDGVEHRYEAGFLLEGDYLAALTCDAIGDSIETSEFDPDLDTAEPQDLSFIAEQIVTVDVGATADGSF